MGFLTLSRLNHASQHLQLWCLRGYQRFRQKLYRRCMGDYKIYASKQLIDKRHPQIVRYARRSAKLGNDALMNELFFISFFVKAQKEVDEASYDRWIHDFAALAWESGKKQARALHPPENYAGNRIAFLGLGDDPSAYKHLYHLCDYLNRSGHYKSYLFVFAAQDNLEKLRHEFSSAATPVIHVPFNESAIIASCLSMRDMLAHERIDVAIWAHLPVLAFPLFAMRVAPKHVFLSQYLHPDLSRFGIDLLTYGSIGKKTSVFLHDPWRTIPSALEIPLDNAGKTESSPRAYASDDGLVIATFGRIEKIRQKEFLRAVACILAAVPNATYLYTGYEDDPAIGAFFAQEKLAERVRFIGWVDIDATAPSIDLVLDSFPLATGITALKCMAFGKPVLSIGDRYSYMGRDIRPIAEQEFHGFNAAAATYRELKFVLRELPFKPYSDNEADYIARAVTLLTDEKARRQLAEFQQLCMEKLYTNTRLMGEIFMEQLKEIQAA